MPLSSRTSLELGGEAEYFTAVESVDALTEALGWARARGLPVTILGGGSNLVVADAGVPGLTIAMRMRGVEYRPDGPRVQVTAMAGEPWDTFVATTVEQDLAGLECLSGIPGLVGATPVQNVGAYGQDVGQTIVRVQALNRQTLAVHELSGEACAFRYRDSAFKRVPDRYVLLSVTYGLTEGGAPTLAYEELRRSLGDSATDAELGDVREAVLELRRRKSMVIDPHDPNRRSAGSFFTNPIVSEAEAERVADVALSLGVVTDRSAVPRYPANAGKVKLPAGWLIERSGFARGDRFGAFGISSQHALALVHHGGGTTAQLVDVARRVVDGVRARYGITLVPEPVFVGFDGHPVNDAPDSDG